MIDYHQIDLLRGTELHIHGLHDLCSNQQHAHINIFCIHVDVCTVGLSDTTVYVIYHSTMKLMISQYLLNNYRDSFNT